MDCCRLSSRKANDIYRSRESGGYHGSVSFSLHSSLLHSAEGADIYISQTPSQRRLWMQIRFYMSMQAFVWDLELRGLFSCRCLAGKPGHGDGTVKRPFCWHMRESTLDIKTRGCQEAVVVAVAGTKWRSSSLLKPCPQPWESPIMGSWPPFCSPSTNFKITFCLKHPEWFCFLCSILIWKRSVVIRKWSTAESRELKSQNV